MPLWVSMGVIVAGLFLASMLMGLWALIVVLGAALAYVGDSVAGYYGKRRLSLWGIRPKYTAIAVSMATGALITLLTLAAAALISEEYREALTGVRRLQEERNALERDRRQLSVRLAATQDSLRTAEATRSRLATQIEGLTREQEELSRKVTALVAVLRKKEVGLVALPAGLPILERPLLVPLSIGRSELTSAVGGMLAEMRSAVLALGVRFKEPEPGDVESKLVAGIAGDLGAIADYARKNSSQRIVEAYVRPISLKNINIGERISTVRFDVQPNRIVFPRGSVIVESEADGEAGLEKIVASIFYLDRQVQALMREKGVLEEALVFRLGRVPAAVLLDFTHLADEIKRRGRRVRLTLVAADDIRAFGQISVAYRIALGGGPRPEASAPGAPAATARAPGPGGGTGAGPRR